jgi:hypothetical protein
MTFDLQSKMEVIEACFILVTFALFFSNSGIYDAEPLIFHGTFVLPSGHLRCPAGNTIKVICLTIAKQLPSCLQL